MRELKRINGEIIMNNKIIDWDKLDNYFTVVMTDTELQITLIMNITIWEDECVYLDSWDFNYSMRIFRDDWEDGQFIFREFETNSYNYLYHTKK